ncbi:MAG TPA: uroporphyrinogen decarboxylase family protein [Candidatus Hydrogenedentes bacterium]|nr:uroporphyrinogen decarboxylase family protein [Candidatus Hydrogenedentota bacterium]HPG68551.1 uroporphyrinogen decarboxylase family protein [Candidatus Hydrogenedentota bacterium]
MTSRDRLLRTFRREPVDRVPISTYELNGFNPDAWENQAPSYQRLMDKIRTDTDCLYMWGWSPFADSGLWTSRDEALADGSVVTHSRLRTPRGDLTCTHVLKSDVHTSWQTEHLLKSAEDIDRYLGVLPALFTIDERRVAAARESYAIADERVGDHGVVMNDCGDPSAFVPDLFEFGVFTLMCIQHKDAILELIDALVGPILERFRIDTAEGFGPILRMCGPEYYTPPYLPTEFFREMVVPGASAAAAILDEGGIFLRLHSHGRVREALPMIVAIGAKGVDPLEPPPDGDITLAEVKALYGDRLVLFGNTELKVLEHSSADEVRACVRAQMNAAKGGGGYVMLPTAAPINEPLSPQTERNYFAWIDAGLEMGAY